MGGTPGQRTGGRLLADHKARARDDQPISEEKHEGARVLYELEMGLWEVGLSKLHYDEEHDRFLFPDGKFAPPARGLTGSSCKSEVTRPSGRTLRRRGVVA